MGRLTYGGATAPWKWGGGQRDVLVSLYNKLGVGGLLPTSCRPCVGFVRLLAGLPVASCDVASPLREHLCPLWRLKSSRCVCATPLAMWLQRRLYDVCSRHVAGSVLNTNACNTNKRGGQVPDRRPLAYLIQLSLPF